MASSKECKRGLHPEEVKIWSTLRKSKDPELKCINAIILQRTKDRPSHTFLQAMANIKGDVIRRHPVNLNDNKNSRQVKEMNAKKHQNHKHQNNLRKNCGDCEHHSNLGKNHGENHHPDDETIRLTNGKKIKCHHSFGFDFDDFRFFSQEQKKTLKEEGQATDSKKNWKRNEEKLKS